MNNPTVTKVKTTVKIGVAVAFLGVAALLAVGANRFSNRASINSGRSVSLPTVPNTLNFCLNETAAVSVKSDMVLFRAFGINAAYAAVGNAALELVDTQGHTKSGNVEIRTSGNNEIIRTLSCLTGNCSTSLDTGRYRARGISRDGNWQGEREIEVRAGRTTQYQILLEPIVTTPANAVIPSAEVQQVYEPGTRDLDQGTVKVITGNICDRDNHVVNTSGIITVRQGAEARGMANVASGAFNIFDLPNGTYTLQFQHPAYGFIDMIVTLEPKRFNFTVGER